MLEVILLATLTVGILIFTFPEMEGLYLGLYARAHRWIYGFGNADIWKNIEDEGSKGAIREHLRKLLQTAAGMGTGQSAAAFIVISIACGICGFAVTLGRVGGSVVIFSATFMTFMPYVFLRERVIKKQRQNSYEGQTLITELLNNYKIGYFNMREAVEMTALSLDDDMKCKGVFMNLSKGLNKAGSATEIKGMLEEVRFSINTTWANILVTNMYFALVSGYRVTDALQDLMATISMAEKVKEYTKRENNESIMILKYLIPICYLLTVAGGIKFFGLSWREYIIYQFNTSAGLTWFLLSLFLYIAGIAITSIFAGVKLDL